MGMEMFFWRKVLSLSLISMAEQPFQTSSHSLTSTAPLAQQTHTHTRGKHRRRRLFEEKGAKLATTALSIIQREQEHSRKGAGMNSLLCQELHKRPPRASWGQSNGSQKFLMSSVGFTHPTVPCWRITDISKPNLTAQPHQPVRAVSQWIADTDVQILFSSTGLKEDLKFIYYMNTYETY